MNRIATYYRYAWQPTPPPPMVRFVVLFKSEPKSKHTSERYVFLWVHGDEDSRREMLRTAGRWASDARLSFTWADAAKLSGIVRSQS